MRSRMASPPTHDTVTSAASTWQARVERSIAELEQDGREYEEFLVELQDLHEMALSDLGSDSPTALDLALLGAVVQRRLGDQMGAVMMFLDATGSYEAAGGVDVYKLKVSRAEELTEMILPPEILDQLGSE